MSFFFSFFFNKYSVALYLEQVLVAQSCKLFCDPMDCSLLGSFLCPRDSPGKNTGVGYHFLLQWIFPTQGSNPGLPHCRWILYCLSYREAVT